MQRFIALFVLFAAIHCAFSNEATDQDLRAEIRKLRNVLLDKNTYDPWVAPLVNATDKVRVMMFMEMLHPPVLDTVDHLFEITGIMCLMWDDDRLKWDPSQYGGVRAISLKRKEVWAPMLIQTNPRKTLSGSASSGRVVVHPMGRLRYCFHTSLLAPCTTDLSDFPYDKHECFINYYKDGTINEDAFNAHLMTGPIAGEFDIVNNSAGMRSIEAVEGYTYHVLQLHLVLVRRTQLFHYTITVPMAVATVLSLLVFCLQPGSDRKIMLAGMSLLITVYLVYRTCDAVSGSTRVPKLVKALGVMTLLNSFVILSAVVGMNMARRSPVTSSYRPPSFVVKLCEGSLGRLLCLCDPPFSEKEARGDTADYEANREWYLLAQATDRLFFVLVLLVYVAILC